MRPEWVSDERFATNTARSANREILLPQIRQVLKSFTRAQLLERLTQAQIPCGEVLGMLQALQSERTAQAGLLHRFEDSEAGTQAVLAPPYAMDGERLPVRLAPPHLGEHTRDVLQEILALDTTSIDALRSQGVI